MAESIGLEEANRIRVAMGLKPIGVSNASAGPVFKDTANNDTPEGDQGSTLETRSAAAHENWLKLQEEENGKKKRQERKDRIKKERDAAARNAKMAGKGLADVDDEQDTATWLKNQARRKKKIAKEEKEAAEKEAAKKRAEYTASDLAGVKVAHELAELDAGADQIFTIKDVEIGSESEDDELENTELREKEKTHKRLEAKKKKNVYNPLAADDNGETSVLAQYDEEIDGAKRHVFTLDGRGSTKEAASMAKQDAKERSKGVVISLDILKDDAPISDYKELTEIKMRKPKKKKSKTTRKKADDDDDIFPISRNSTDAMDVDSGLKNGTAATSKKRTLDDDFVDDEDLQSQLARQRRETLKKRKKIRPEDLARQMRHEEENTMDGVLQSVEEGEVGLVIDETSEFVQNLRPAGSEDEKGAETPPTPPDHPAYASSDEDADMDDVGAYREVAYEDKHGKRATSSVAPEPTTGLEEEGTLTKGLGSTLGLLRQRGLLKDPDSTDMNISFRDRQKFLAEKRNRDEDAERRARVDRENDRESGRLNNLTAREREDFARQQNTKREQAESRQMTDMYNKEYKPTVELKYIDEYGREMNQKEAFKHLSHQFHGKGSGKQKHEKRLKKIENEKKREAASALDSSQHVSATAMGDRARKNKQAGVRLQ